MAMSIFGNIFDLEMLLCREVEGEYQDLENGLEDLPKRWAQ